MIGLNECIYGTIKETEQSLSGDPQIFNEKRKILRNFEIFLPKFHFIFPKFCFPPPWGIFRLLAGYFRFPRDSPQIVLGFCKF